jgi:hypothetical protein
VNVIDLAGHWLAPEPAAALARALDAGCPADITSAGRSVDAQLELIRLHRIDPAHHAYAAPILGPDASEHIAGYAIDAGPRMTAWFATHPRFGFVATALPAEPWHHAYRPASDAYRDAGPTTPHNRPKEDPVFVLLNNTPGSKSYGQAFALHAGRGSSISDVNDPAEFEKEGVPVLRVSEATYLNAVATWLK